MSVLPVGIGSEEAAGGYTIERSLRFNSADSAYLNRTPASNGSLTTVTFSYWVKRAGLSNGVTNRHHTLYSAAYDWSSTDSITFNPSDNLILFLNGSSSGYFVTTQVFRDASSWYHIVIAIDTTQATEANRVKIYVNGEQITSFTTATYPTQNYNFAKLNRAAYAQGIGYAGNSGATEQSYFSGYMANVDFVDGQQLTPADFGEYNATTGVWQPIAYAGTYGTNGFHLDFSDNSSTSALGTDSSGNGNNWTSNNFSVTAGAGNDSLVDTPTPYGTDTGAGGEVGGNYCTLNPLFPQNDSLSIQNGNLRAYKGSGTATGSFFGTAGITSGKWYWEMNCVATGANDQWIGIGQMRTLLPSGYPGNDAYCVAAGHNNSALRYNGSNVGSYTMASWTAGDTISIALDMDNGKVYWAKNGTWQNSGDPAAGTGAYTNATIFDGNPILPVGSLYQSNGDVYYNFGQRPFAYTAPSGFKALCTTNLPEPAVVQGDTAFNTVIYTGTNSTQSITGVGFQPDLLWIKSRSGTTYHALFDAVRGRAYGLSSNATDAEYTSSAGRDVASFDSDGFTVGQTEQWGSTNASGASIVAWNWKGGGSGVSNTDGSITSTVSANPTAGISVVTYTGNSTSGSTVGHGLGVTPSMIIIKGRTDNANNNWYSYHISIGPTAAIALNLAALPDSGSHHFNNTSPGPSVFTLGNSYSGNRSSNTYVAYCFAPVEGFSAFGSYTGNGSTDGPFIYTGFRPAFVLIKRTNVNQDNWWIHDSVRSPYNQSNNTLSPSLSDSEYTIYNFCDLTSNGFKLRSSNTATNTSGSNFIYMAFAENPFKYSLAR